MGSRGSSRRTPPVKGAAPSGPSRPASRVERTRTVDGVRRVTEIEPERVHGPEAASGVTPSGRAQATDVVGRVAASLRSGELTVRQAVASLIEDAIERQVGRALADRPALARELRLLLETWVEGDPALAARIRRLTEAE